MIRACLGIHNGDEAKGMNLGHGGERAVFLDREEATNAFRKVYGEITGGLYWLWSDPALRKIKFPEEDGGDIKVGIAWESRLLLPLQPSTDGRHSASARPGARLRPPSRTLPTSTSTPAPGSTTCSNT